MIMQTCRPPRHTFANRFVLNSSIARNCNGWESRMVFEPTSSNLNEKVAYWHDHNGVKIIRCDLFEPTENTDQAFHLIVEWDLTNEGREFMIKAAEQIADDEIVLEDDPHCFVRLQVCIAALSCCALICGKDFHEELDYAF